MRQHQQQADKLNAEPDEAKLEAGHQADSSVSHRIAVNIHQSTGAVVDINNSPRHKIATNTTAINSVRISEPVSDGDQMYTIEASKKPAVIIQTSSVAMLTKTTNKRELVDQMIVDKLLIADHKYRRPGSKRARPNFVKRNTLITDCQLRSEQTKLVKRRRRRRTCLTGNRKQTKLEIQEACGDILLVETSGDQQDRVVEQIKTERASNLNNSDTMTATSLVTLTPIHRSQATDMLHMVDQIDDQQVGQDCLSEPNDQPNDHHFIPRSPASNNLDRHDKITEAQLDRLASLIKIIQDGDYREFSELLEQRSFKNLLNVFVDGHTALHYSLIYGRSLAWCKQLVLYGANPNLTNRAGWHPIHLAAFNGSRDTMRYLIDCLAN